MYRILIVDDEPMIRMGLQQLIRQSGVPVERIETAGNGAEALDSIARSRPDMLLTDIRMPRMDGIELCRQVQQCYGDIAVAVVSGYGEFEYAKQCITYGVKEYLLKPVTKSGVSETLRKLAFYRMRERRQMYIPISLLEEWLERLETAVWHLRQEELESVLHDIESYCGSLRLGASDLARLLEELYAKLVRQLNRRDVYAFGTGNGSFRDGAAEERACFSAFRQSVERTAEELRMKRKGGGKEPVEEAKAYIERNLSKELTLDEVAEMLGLNSSYFSQLFKLQTDETFVHYRIKRRMEKAKKLLAVPHYKITDVSYEVGYADHPHFTKTFKRFTGYTPTEYRDMLGIK